VEVSLRELFEAPTIERMLDVIFSKTEESVA
jgi:aryl carrier-like protein